MSRARMPKGWRENRMDYTVACPHRDCSVCDACAAAHDECEEVLGSHMWIADPDERAALRARAAACVITRDAEPDVDGNGPGRGDAHR